MPSFDHRHIIGLAFALALVGACWLAWRWVEWGLAGTWAEEFGLVLAAVAMVVLLRLAEAIEARLAPP